MARILFVDDERMFRAPMARNIAAEGYEVVEARDGDDALAKFDAGPFDLVLVDVMMPNLNGFAVCEEIRRRDRTVPLVFLTARDGDADQVRALGLGADDYLSKTVSMPLLLARIRRALERRADADRLPEGVMVVGRATVDLERLEVSCGGDVEKLTRTEGDLLRIILSDATHAFSCQELITALRGEGFVCEDGMVYTHMSRIRRKLGSEGWRLVRTGAGYRLDRRSR